MPSPPREALPALQRRAVTWRVLCLCVALSTAWTVVLAREGGPTVTLTPGLHDAPSNLYSTWVFWGEGLGIYDRPTGELLGPVSEHEEAAFSKATGIPPGDLGRWEVMGQERVVAVVWPQLPRLYPPGAFLAWTPLAWAHAAGLVDLRPALLAMAFVWVVCAHLAIAVTWRHLDDPQAGTAARALIAVAVAVAGSEAVWWSLSSQHEAIFVLAVVLAWWNHHRDRPGAAVGLMGLAAFLHFRALIFAPLAVAAVAGAWRRRQWGWLAAGGALAASAGVAFLRAYATHTGEGGPRNPLHPATFQPDIALVVVAVTVVAATALAWSGNRLGAVQVTAVPLVVAGTEFVQWWYVVALFPLLMVVPPRARSIQLQVLAAAALVVVFGAAVFGTHLWALRLLGG